MQKLLLQVAVVLAKYGNVFGNATVRSFQRDAEAALNVLMQRPEVDRGNITLLGISEGTTIAPRIAIDRSDDVKNIVLMSAAAQTLYEIMYANWVNRIIFFAQELWDDNHDGLVPLQEVPAHPSAYLTVPVPSSVAGTTTTRILLLPITVVLPFSQLHNSNGIQD